VRSSAAAEKDGEGMALKIRTRAKDMPDGKDNLESQSHTKWKRARLFDSCAPSVKGGRKSLRTLEAPILLFRKGKIFNLAFERVMTSFGF
jgi:hypothetical protein